MVRFRLPTLTSRLATLTAAALIAATAGVDLAAQTAPARKSAVQKELEEMYRREGRPIPDSVANMHRQRKMVIVRPGEAVPPPKKKGNFFTRMFSRKRKPAPPTQAAPVKKRTFGGLVGRFFGRSEKPGRPAKTNLRPVPPPLPRYDRAPAATVYQPIPARPVTRKRPVQKPVINTQILGPSVVVKKPAPKPQVQPRVVATTPGKSSAFADGINLGQHFLDQEPTPAPAVARKPDKANPISNPFEQSPFSGKIASEHTDSLNKSDSKKHPLVEPPKKVANVPNLKPAPKPAPKNQTPPKKVVVKKETKADAVARKKAMVARRKGMKGLKGFCPVVLRDRRDLADTNVTFSATHDGRTWFFSSAKARDAFVKSPTRYAPVKGGRDVVFQAAGANEVEGSLDFAVWYRDRLYLFTSTESMKAFVANPRKYDAAAVSSKPAEPKRLDDRSAKPLPKAKVEKKPKLKPEDNPFVIPDEEPKVDVPPAVVEEKKAVEKKAEPKPLPMPEKKPVPTTKKLAEKKPAAKPKAKPAEKTPAEDPFAPFDGPEPDLDDKNEFVPFGKLK